MTTAAYDSTVLFGQAPDAHDPSPVSQLLTRMLDSGEGISDLVFSPGRPPQVEAFGELRPVVVPGFEMLGVDDTLRIARHLVSGNEQATRTLKAQGACDLSYSVPERARFRVNVFRQRGSYAVVMRVIAPKIPTIADLGLPHSLSKIASLKSGIVLVTGGTGVGKSSTLAAIVDLINETRAEHIITIEDPVEFLHTHKRGTVHQRELYSDTPTFALALRSALRQSPKVILVGEMRDRDTIEIALTAAETGHLVLSTLHTLDASKTIERIVGAFEAAESATIRTRFAGSFRCIVSQRLVPGLAGGRAPVIEVLWSTMRTREYIANGESGTSTLVEAMRDGALEGMQTFDGELERLVREGMISVETALGNATNASDLRLTLADVPDAFTSR